MSDNAPGEIWNWANVILERISDEIGIKTRGRYLLVYEGWSSLCVDPAWNPDDADEANEEAAYQHAADKSGVIIQEWVEEFDATITSFMQSINLPVATA